MRRLKWGNYNWIIMNANSWISGKPSIKTIIKKNRSNGIIMVVERNTGEKKILNFVMGSRGDYGKVGEIKRYLIDTGHGYGRDGECFIQNIITISEDEVMDPGNGIGLNEKRALYVFK